MRNWLKKLIKPKESDLISTLLQGRHTIVTGLSGTGKTMLLSLVLEEAREYPAVIVDPRGEHLGMFYRPGDRILNPRDSRSEYWTPWTDIKEHHHFEEIARLLVPSEKNGLSVNVRAARIMLAKGLEKTPTKSVKDLIMTCSGMIETGLPELDEFTEAAHRISPDLPPTLLAYVTMLACVKESLNSLWLPGPEPEFSLRDWAQAPTGWLFITGRMGFCPDLSPLVSTWVEVLASELSQPLVIVIDGLSHLQPPSALQRLLSPEGPRGITCFTAFHTISELRHAWGVEVADSFCARCDNVVSFHADMKADVRSGDHITTMKMNPGERPYAAPGCIPVDAARTYWGPWNPPKLQEGN